MKKYEIIYTLDEVTAVAQELRKLLSSCSGMTFTGSLGAGKTTLVQELLRQCGIKGAIQSPTFTYVNIYLNERRQTFYHFDLYRLSSPEAFMALGLQEYLYNPNSWSLIEWPAVIDSLLTHDVCRVTVEYIDEAHRRLLYEIDDSTNQ